MILKLSTFVCEHHFSTLDRLSSARLFRHSFVDGSSERTIEFRIMKLEAETIWMAREKRDRWVRWSVSARRIFLAEHVTRLSPTTAMSRY